MPTPREAYTNSVERQGYSGARLRPADFGSAGETIARAGQQVGQALGQASESLLAVQKEDAATLAQEADNMRVAQRLKYFYDGDDGFFNKQGQAAVEASQRVPQDLQKIDQDVAGTLLKNNAWARRMYDEVTAKRNADDLPRIYRHTATQKKVHEDAVFENTFDLAIDNAANALDPKIIEENIATVGNIAVNRMIRQGEYDNNLLEQTRQTAVGKAVSAIAQRMEQKSPMEAQAFVVSHAHMMDPQDTAKLLDTLAPAAANEGAWTAADSVIAAVTTGATTGNTFQRVDGQAPAAGYYNQPTGEYQPTPIPPMDAVAAALLNVETPGGRHTDASGRMITSGAGAQGAGQIMPKTGPNPGYGVKPLQNHSYAEHVRFSKDLLKAYTRHFDGDVVLGLTAYNWGPGNVEDHIKRVGDPRTGKISDAAFVNSIPNAEARDYAPKVLAQVGVNVSGNTAPSVAMPYTAQTFDLSSAINLVENDPNRTYIEKQAVISALKEKHSLGRQAKAEAEERVTDAAWTEVNQLGDSFTSYNQLPLNLRQQLATNPQQEAAFRNMADANKRAQQAALDKEQDKITDQAELDLQELQYVNPDKFVSIDLRTDPTYSKMTASKISAWMGRQEDVRKAKSNPANSVSYDKVRTSLIRIASKDLKKDTDRMSFHYNEAIKRAEALARQTGKPLDDAQYEAIAADVLSTVIANVGGEERTMSKAEVQSLLKPGQTVTVRMNPYEEARNQLKKRFGREPLPQEIDAAIALKHGGR